MMGIVKCTERKQPSVSENYSRYILDMIVQSYRIQQDRARQAMNNNLWDNNPGEIERWADDGGAQ